MEIFIDTSTGTWGAAEDIVFLTVENPNEVLEYMTDSEICEFGNENGDAPILTGF